jgi:hypothetical protein
MNLARVCSAAAACIVLGAIVAGCSGSLGAGSGLPQTVSTPFFGAQPSSSPTTTNVVLTVGDSTAFQSVGQIGGYAASIAFPAVTPEPAKSPSGKAASNASPSPGVAPTPVSIAVGGTLSVIKPNDGPDLNLESGKGRHRKSRERPARALAYITLLPTHDVTLGSYPRITLDMPREIASQYRDGEFGIALWNSGEKDDTYHLAVAELDTSATPPPAAAARPVATGTPTAAGTPTPMPMSRSGPMMAPLAVGSVAPVPAAAPTLPPQRIIFVGTEKPLKLMANRPAVFAIYALPHVVSASPEPSASALPLKKGGAAPSGASAAPVSPSSGGSTMPAGSALPAAMPSASP